MTSPRTSPWWPLALAIVLVSAVLGRWPLHPLGEAAALLAVSITTLWFAPLGLALLIAAGQLSPWAVPTGTHTSLSLLWLLVPALFLGWAARAAARGALMQALCARPALALNALAGAALASFAVANLTPFGCGGHAPMRAQLGALASLMMPAAIYVVASALERPWIERLTWLFIAIGGTEMVTRFVPGLRGAPLAGADGSLFWVWLVALAAGQAVANRELPPEWRLALGWLVVIIFSVATGEPRREWLAGWVPALVALGAIAALLAPRRAAAAAGGGGIAVLIAVAWILRAGVVTRNLYSLETRWDAAGIVLRMLGRNPVVGFGPANYYHCTPQFRIRGYAVPFSSHNNYIDLVAQTGVLGLACLLWFVGASVQLGLRVWRRAPNGFARGYACGCLGGLAGTLVAAAMGDWWLPFAYNVTLAGLRSSLLAWIFLGGLSALAREAA